MPTSFMPHRVLPFRFLFSLLVLGSLISCCSVLLVRGDQVGLIPSSFMSHPVLPFCFLFSMMSRFDQVG